MAKMRVPKGVDPSKVGVSDFAVGGMASGPDSVRKALGGVQGPHSMATLRRLTEVFRPKDLSKALPEAASQVPPRLGTSGKIDSAFADYLEQVAKLLGR